MQVTRLENFLPSVIGLVIALAWSLIFLLLPYRQQARLGRELQQHGVQRVDQESHLERWLTRWRCERTYLLGRGEPGRLAGKLTALLARRPVLQVDQEHSDRIVVRNDQVRRNINFVRADDFSRAVIEVRIQQEGPAVHCLVVFDVLARAVVWIIIAFGVAGLLLVLLAGSDASWHGLRTFYALFLVVFLGLLGVARVIAQFLATGNFFDALVIEALEPGSGP